MDRGLSWEKFEDIPVLGNISDLFYQTGSMISSFNIDRFQCSDELSSELRQVRRHP